MAMGGRLAVLTLAPRGGVGKEANYGCQLPEAYRLRHLALLRQLLKLADLGLRVVAEADRGRVV